ncbi:MAG: AmmeMemoRadiSam system protein B [Candidatus Nitrohelix vancouverensis]|uniref:MEMO1 family protein G3M78_05465 n=1 Tax=Candidatus Nitrohelix vancouverensis TaxID=2705534 RepID=A0A7T0G321_9BACT|nr:MAG: AmmeMemoRadiSam system protein B [Candidatus Nitrohelix vancouverensis]
MIRAAAVAGRFYPGDAEALSRDLTERIDSSAQARSALGVLVPHAGYMYSGDVAGAVYSRIEFPETVILLGPNHSGEGAKVAVMTEGVWQTPLGQSAIDSELAEAICGQSTLATADARAHGKEHSLETQLPFLQFFKPDIKIVPICLSRLDWPSCQKFAQAILSALGSRRVLIVASSDMSHYVSDATARRQDALALHQLEARDPQRLLETVRANQISMCGVVPATVMLVCANALGARQCETISYRTSGDVNGDLEHVVGYAGAVIR